MRRPRAYAASKSRLCRRRSRAGSVSRPGIAPLGKITGWAWRTAPAARMPPLVLGYQLAAALGAAPRQHLAAVLGGHACPEPMRTLAPHLARLIGTLHTVGSVGRSGVADKKGGKAKPLSVKVSIRQTCERLQQAARSV